VPDRHEYELYPAEDDIEHTRTKTCHPHTNGICERFRKAMLDEFHRGGGGVPEGDLGSWRCFP
jgi:transposase InsO family protein